MRLRLRFVAVAAVMLAALAGCGSDNKVGDERLLDFEEQVGERLGETTTTTAPAATEPATPLGPPVPEPPPPQEEDGEGDLAGQSASVPRSSRPDGGVNASVVLLIAALIGAGAFGAWTLWKLRPGNA